jgi:hypothetical protein
VGGLHCNPGYLGGRDLENCGLRPAQAKSSQNPISTNKKLNLMYICHPSYEGRILRSYSKNN